MLSWVIIILLVLVSSGSKRGSLTFYILSFLPDLPVTLPVVLGVEIIDVDLVVVVWYHGLLTEIRGRCNKYVGYTDCNLRWRKNFRQSISNFGVQHGREDHVKLKDHPPLLEWVPVLRHALALDLLQVTSLDDFSCENISQC